MRTSRRMMVCGTALVALLSVAACGGGEKATPTRAPAAQPTATVARPQPSPTSVPTPTPKIGARLRIAIPSFAGEEIQPSFGRLVMGRTYMGPMFDWLTLLDADGAVIPAVLDRWQMAPDAKEWTLGVRQGMRWHNGDPVTADDVKFTLDTLIAHADSPRRATNATPFKTNIASVTAVSPASVRVSMQVPWSLMLQTLSPRSGSEGAMVPKAYTDKVGEKGFEENPIGTGPWQLARHDLGVRFLYQPAPGTHPFRPTPQYREMEITVVPEEATRLASLRSGAVDIVSIGSFDSAKAVAKERDLRVLTIPRISVAAVHFMGVGDPRIQSMPTAKREVRQALVMAVNTKEIGDTLFGGLGEVAPRMLIVPGTLGWDPNWKPETYDPAKAKDLLASAGYARGFNIQILSYAAPGAAWMPSLSEAVAGYWSAVGVTPRIVTTEAGNVYLNWRKRPQPEEYIGQAAPNFGAVTPTNIDFLRTVYHSKGITYLHPFADTDAVLDQASQEINVTKQGQLITQFMDMIWADRLDIPVSILPDIYGVGPGVGQWKNVHLGGVGLFAETITAK